MEKVYEIAIIGGGAAGFFAAINIAENLPNASITILEKSNKVLGKVKVSGGGRCNITHDCDSPSKLLHNYPRGKSILKNVFAQFAVKHTVEWFTERGLPLKTENDGRMFPKSNSSQSVIDLFLSLSKKYNIDIRLNEPAYRISIHKKESETTFILGQKAYHAIVVCAGGHPKPEGYAFLSSTQHHVVKPVPSLFTFNVPKHPFKELQGVSLPVASAKIQNLNFTNSGPLLFTHWGLSGPLILKLSAFAARELHEVGYHFQVYLKMVDGMNEVELTQHFMNLKIQNKHKTVILAPQFGLPVRLWRLLCTHAGIESTLRWGDISNKKINKLVQNIFNFPIEVSGKTTFKDEFVTAGGVDTLYINHNTMQSKLHNGLFFAGEVLDIDGITGGFNFQAAWSTAWVAAQNVVKYLREQSDE